jgi:hypothetical protein
VIRPSWLDAHHTYVLYTDVNMVLIALLKPACPHRSFTDIAFIDFLDTSRDWLSNGIISAAAYAQRLGRSPQSLNDFKASCTRLAAAGQLPMPFQLCEDKRKLFGESIKIIRCATQWLHVCVGQ